MLKYHRPETDFTKVDNSIIGDARIDVHEKAILLYILSLNQDADLTPSWAQLMTVTGMSRSSVGRALQRLHDKNILIPKRRYNKTNKYHLNPISSWDLGEK